jgi:hypothetical protein
MTLLEVLISCGVLVIGLASIASLLPAAASRLGQAALEDRAGALAANAHTDAFARGLVAADLFADPAKSIGFGKGMTTLPTVAGTQFAAPTAALAQRIDLQRGFLQEDEVLFAAPATAETPLNDFPDGRRAFKEGLCWGATLVPQTFPAQAGTPAMLGVAVFRREPTLKPIALQKASQGGGLYTMSTFNESDLKTYLKSCSYVLVPSKNANEGPRWCQIAASWSVGSVAFLTFADPAFDSFAPVSPTVIAFDNVVRVDQHNVILQ